MSASHMAATNVARSSTTDRNFYVFNAVVSAAALSFLAYLLLVRRGGSGGWDLRFLPALNAGLNSAAASFLVAGYVAIRRGARRLHQYLMVSAFVSSALFFICYVAYHYAHGDTKFAGTGLLRIVYLSILASHIVLSIAVVPMSLTTLWLSFRKNFARHKSLARVTLPIWLYVSVTGVVIFFMLRGSPPALP
jgi:putative membrane protein